MAGDVPGDNGAAGALTDKQRSWLAEKEENRAERALRKVAGPLPVNKRVSADEIALVREKDESLTITCRCGVHQRFKRQGMDVMARHVHQFEKAHRKCKKAGE